MPARALPHAPSTSPAAPEHLPTLSAHLAHWAHHTPGRRAFTFAEHPSSGLRGSLRTLTWHRLDIRARAVAARLAETVASGERVALLCPQGADYVVGFLAALRAGFVAVPLFTPDLPGHDDRLAGVLADARPSAVLTTSGAVDSVRAFLDAHGLRPRVIVTDLVPDDQAGAPLPPAPDDQATAYLQYTSGSTRFPMRRRDLARERRGQRPPGAHRVRRRHPPRHHGRLAAALPRHGTGAQRRRSRRTRTAVRPDGPRRLPAAARPLAPVALRPSERPHGGAELRVRLLRGRRQRRGQGGSAAGPGRRARQRQRTGTARDRRPLPRGLRRSGPCGRRPLSVVRARRGHRLRQRPPAGPAAVPVCPGPRGPGGGQGPDRRSRRPRRGPARLLWRTRRTVGAHRRSGHRDPPRRQGRWARSGSRDPTLGVVTRAVGRRPAGPSTPGWGGCPAAGCAPAISARCSTGNSWSPAA